MIQKQSSSLPAAKLSPQNQYSIKELLLLGLFAAAVRVFYLLLLQPLPEWSLLSVDNWYYHNWSQLLATNGWLGEGSYFRAPLYPIFLSVFYQLFGPDLVVAKVFGLIVSTGSVLLTGCIAARLFGRHVGFAALVLHALLPLSLFFDHELLAEGLFLFFLLTCIQAWLIWQQERSLRGLWLLSFGISAAMLTRPVAVIFIPLVVIGLIFTLRPASLFDGIQKITALLLPAVLFFSPLVVRNLRVQAEPFTIATQGGINFYIANHEEADGISASMPEPMGFNWQLKDVSLQATTALQRGLKPEEVSDFWFRKGMDWIKSEPADALALAFTKLRWALNGREVPNNRPNEPYLESHPLLQWNPIRFVILFPLAILGMILAWRHFPSSRVVAISGLMLFLLLIVFLVASRYRYPMVVCLLPFSAFGLMQLIDALKAKLIPSGDRLSYAVAAVFLLIVLLPAPSMTTYTMPTYTTSGLALMSDRRAAEALDLFRRDIATGAPETALNVGNAHLALGSSDSAGYYYERERLAYPARSKAWSNLASLTLARGEVDSAISLVRQALQRRPHDRDASLLYLRALVADQNDDTLVLAARHAVGITRDLSLAVDASALLLRRAKAAEAVSLLELATSFLEIPYEQDDRMRSAEILTARKNQRVIQAKALQNLSTGYLFVRNPVDAVRAARLAIALTPDSIEAKGALILALHESGLNTERDAAMAALSQTEQNSPEFVNLFEYIKSGKKTAAPAEEALSIPIE